MGLDIWYNFPACFLAPGSSFPPPKSEEKEFEYKFTPSIADKWLYTGLLGWLLLCICFALLQVSHVENSLCFKKQKRRGAGVPGGFPKP